MKYDYLIVGAGLFGSVCAYELYKKGYKCLVVEKRNHIGGNIYTEKIEDINVHKYGAHIFHTSDKFIWDYINQFAKFNNFINCPIARYKDEIYNLPFNMNTFVKLWNDVFTPQQAQDKIESEKKIYHFKNPHNLEEQAINLVGITIYEKLIKEYTEKQWGKNCKNLPAFIIKRLPVRFTFNNNYFNDCYQGIPIGGYTQIIEKMLNGNDVKINYDYFDHLDELNILSNKIIYTGPIDQYFNYCYGALEYRSLRFKEEVLNISNYQGNAVVNYTDKQTPYTRIIEHKHFEFGEQEKTVISKEFPTKWKLGDEPYYPINDEKNDTLYKKYKILSNKQNKVIFGGRLGEYKYYDMHNVIQSALSLIDNITKK